MTRKDAQSVAAKVMGICERCMLFFVVRRCGKLIKLKKINEYVWNLCTFNVKRHVVVAAAPYSKSKTTHLGACRQIHTSRAAGAAARKISCVGNAQTRAVIIKLFYCTKICWIVVGNLEIKWWVLGFFTFKCEKLLWKHPKSPFFILNQIRRFS